MFSLLAPKLRDCLSDGVTFFVNESSRYPSACLHGVNRLIVRKTTQRSGDLAQSDALRACTHDVASCRLDAAHSIAEHHGAHVRRATAVAAELFGPQQHGLHCIGLHE